MGPDIRRTTTSDGVELAWSSVGSGPTLLQLPGVPFADLAAEWRIPAQRRAYERSAGRVRLVQFDARGAGQSQRDIADLSHEAFLRDIDAVVAACGATEVVLLGFYHSALHAIPWAARHPDRVRGLVLFGGALRGWDLMRDPGTQALLSLIERDWDTFVESVTHAWLGWPAGDEGRLAADWIRASTTPAVARAALETARTTDVAADAARVDCPVLVLHRRDAAVIPLHVSKELAAGFSDGRLQVIPGGSASLFMEATDEIVDRILAFVRDPAAPGGSPGEPQTSAATALSTRETEVLRLIANGESNGQIAAALGLSINTVERHVSNIYRKIDARGRADATAWALRHGLA